MRISSIYLSLIYSVFALNVFAQAIGPQAVVPAKNSLTLTQAIATALEHQPSLQKAEAKEQEAEAKVREVRAAYYPQLSVSGIAKVGLSGATNALDLMGFPASPFYRNFAGSLNLSEAIFDFGRIHHALAAAKLRAEAAVVQKQAEDRRIALVVTQAYLLTIAATNPDQFARITEQAEEMKVRRTSAFYQAKLAAKHDVVEAEAELAMARGNLAHTTDAVHAAYAALDTAMGIEETSVEPSLVMPATAQTAIPPLSDEIATALRTRPEMKASSLTVQALREELALARAQSRPTMNGFAAGGGGRFNDSTVKPNQQHGVGAVGVEMPVYTGGRLKAERVEALAEVNAAQADNDLLKQQVELEVSRSYYGLADKQAQVRALTEERSAAEQALHLAQARYAAHLISAYDVIQAQVQLSRVEAQATQDDIDYQVMLANLEFATGESVSGGTAPAP
ncbi:MAG: TolC family protein [Acidobacteriaceae bacterium]